MKKIVRISIFLFLVSCKVSTQKNVVNDVETYTVTIMDWYSSKENDIPDCEKYILSIEADTIVPNYFIKYGNEKYRLDSYLYNQGEISFWYDIFDNRSKECSFILFYAEAINQHYSYTVYNINKNNIETSRYYSIQSISPKHIKSTQIIDTISTLQYTDIVMSIKDFIDKDFKFPYVNGINIAYLMSNGEWTRPPKDKEEELIRKHYLFISH